MPDPNLHGTQLAAVATRLRSLRVDLDRLDDAIDLLPRTLGVELTRYSLHMRDALDSLEAAIDEMGAGLAPPLHSDCGTRHRPGTDCPEDR